MTEDCEMNFDLVRAAACARPASGLHANLRVIANMKLAKIIHRGTLNRTMHSEEDTTFESQDIQGSS